MSFPDFEINEAELREVRWCAFLAGFDARHCDGPLEDVFNEWCERERNARLDELAELSG